MRPSVYINGSLYNSVDVQSIIKGVSNLPGRAMLRFSQQWADADILNYGDLIQITVPSGSGVYPIFLGEILDFDPRTVREREDVFTAVAFDLRNRLKRNVVGDPHITREPRVGYDIIFNEDGLANKLQGELAFAPKDADSIDDTEAWTFADALQYVMDTWAVGLSVSYNPSTTEWLPHWSEEMPPLSVFGLNVGDAIDAIVNLWGFGSWAVDSSGNLIICAIGNPLQPSKTVELYPTNNTTAATVPTNWAAIDFSFHENLSATFNNSTVCSAKITREALYLYHSSGSLSGDMLMKDATWESTEDEYIRLIVNPLQYENVSTEVSGSGLGDNLEPNAFGKVVLGEQLREPGAPPEATQESLQFSPDNGDTWQVITSTFSLEFEPFSIILPQHITTDANVSYDLSKSFLNYAISIVGPTVIEDRMYSDPGVGNAALCQRRIIVREDIKPMQGYVYDNTSDTQDLLDAISTRAQQIEGKRMLRLSATTRDLVPVEIGDYIQLNPGSGRSFDFNSSLMCVAAIEHHGSNVERTTIHAATQMGEPANAIARAVFDKKVINDNFTPIKTKHQKNYKEE